jgi:flagellar biosynthetic protein FliP
MSFDTSTLYLFATMVAGMLVLGPVWSFAWPGLSGIVTAQVLVMATNMSLGMAVWMRIRRHGWASIAEMSAAMYLPFLVLLPFYWTGVLPEMVLMAAGHVLMLPAMLAAMLLRRHEYSC